MAVKMANISTIGVYILANLFTNVSVLAFLSVAFSTKSNILFTVLLENSLVTLTRITSPILIVPDNTLSLVETSLGTTSPVI